MQNQCTPLRLQTHNQQLAATTQENQVEKPKLPTKLPSLQPPTVDAAAGATQHPTGGQVHARAPALPSMLCQCVLCHTNPLEQKVRKTPATSATGISAQELTASSSSHTCVGQKGSE